jgi:hypothetical protein
MFLWAVREPNSRQNSIWQGHTISHSIGYRAERAMRLAPTAAPAADGLYRM